MQDVVNNTSRIEYIDALRGFTMVLVVLHHVSLMAFGIVDSSIEKYSYEVRMPLFFFISGFLMYKPSTSWDLKNSFMFIKKKFITLMVSPMLFFLIFVYENKRSLIESLSSPAKAGYWFTFMLFTYFLIYIVSQVAFDRLRLSSKHRDCALLCVGLLVFLLAYVVSFMFLERNVLWMGIIGGGNLKYFIFLALGTLAQKHKDSFEELLDSTPVVLTSFASFFLMNIFYIPINGLGGAFRLLFILLSACTGIIVVWSFFRKYKKSFSSNQPILRYLPIIGRRTLDIYLLHYFFIPSQLGGAFPIFSNYSLPLLEFVCSLSIAFLIIAVCLGVSSVLRLSPTLGWFLFGAKKTKKRICS